MKRSNLLAVLVGLIALVAFANHASAMYDPGLGRWVQRDPGPGGVSSPVRVGQYHDGTNLYQYVRSNPLTQLDQYGLWNSDVHQGSTAAWAQAEGMTESGANAVGKYDAAVDSGPTNPVTGDQNYHFDGNRGSGQDTRLLLYNQHLGSAIGYCIGRRDDPAMAAMHLGTALHPLQDWVAHGDYGFNAGRGRVMAKHNGDSEQKDLRSVGKWDVTSYPDDPTLDARGDPDGRPSGAAMLHTSSGGEWAFYDQAKPGTISKRMQKTETLTKKGIDTFLKQVKQHGNCNCKAYFLGPGAFTNPKL